MGVLKLIRSYPDVFNVNLCFDYSEHEAIKLIGAAISKGSTLQKETFFVKDAYHAFWRMIDLGFRTTAVELAQKLIPQAAWHQQFAIAQDLCSQMVYHYYLYGNLESAEKFDTMYNKYTSTVACEYQAKKLYSQAIYNHKHNLPIKVEELMQMLDALKEKLQHESLWYQYYYYQCKTLMFEGESLELLLKEAIEYFEQAYYCHTSFISIFTKYLAEFYLSVDQTTMARVLIESKLPNVEVGSIPWFRYLMTYTIILIEDNDVINAEIIANQAITNPKFQELPNDRRIEWDAIKTRIKEILIKENDES